MDPSPPPPPSCCCPLFSFPFLHWPEANVEAAEEKESEQLRRSGNNLEGSNGHKWRLSRRLPDCYGTKKENGNDLVVNR